MPVYPAYPKDLDRFIFADSPPATRRDGSPIQIGDRLFATTSNYFWNGSRWLDTTLNTASIPQFTANSIGATTILNGDILPNVSVWVERARLTGTAVDLTAAGNTAILMQIGLTRPQELITSSTRLISRDLIAEPIIRDGETIYQVNSFRGATALGQRKLQIEFNPTGGTHNRLLGYFFLVLEYRRVL